MHRYKSKRTHVIEVEPLVACLPGYQTINPGPMAKNLTKKFYHKSGTELRLELQQKIKLLN